MSKKLGLIRKNTDIFKEKDISTSLFQMLKTRIKKLLRIGHKPLPYDDNFIRRLNSSVIGEGMLHKGNVYLMDYAVKHMPQSDYILEIGSWGGLSTNLLLYLLGKYGRKEVFLGCDPWIYEGIDDEYSEPPPFIDGHGSIKRKDYMDYIKNAYIQAAYLLHPHRLPYTFQLTSHDFFEQVDKKRSMTDVFGRSLTVDGMISFCYIDGNHSYQHVKEDFEQADKYLVRNGFILFDDSSDGSPIGSSRFMNEVKKNKRYKVVDKNPHYLVQKI